VLVQLLGLENGSTIIWELRFDRNACFVLDNSFVGYKKLVSFVRERRNDIVTFLCLQATSLHQHIVAQNEAANNSEQKVASSRSSHLRAD